MFMLQAYRKQKKQKNKNNVKLGFSLCDAFVCDFRVLLVVCVCDCDHAS